MSSLNEKIRLIKEGTGLTWSQSHYLLSECNGDVDLALESVEYFVKYLSGTTLAKEVINTNIKNAGVYNQLSKNLSKYNTSRGGTNFKGFVFEEMHAADATINGQVTEVIANNGPADFIIKNPNGKVVHGQAKVGYENTSINWSKYQDQTIVVDKGNTKLINQAKKAGNEVIESNISKREAERLAKNMQLESKITKNTNSTIVPKIHSAGKIAKQCHSSGVSAAKSGAAFSSGFSIGSNIVELIDGEKEFGEVVVDIAKDTVVAAGTSYVVGAASTAIGAAATAATTAVASTAVGGAAIGAATAATTAIAGTATAATTAVASTAIGGAAIGAATAATTAIAGTAVGAAAIAAAPVVAAGAVIGGVFTLGKKIFGK